MANSESKNWWEQNLDWSLSGSLQGVEQMLKNIPNTLSAHKLDKPSPQDRLTPDPVTRISTQQRKMPRIMAPPPKPTPPPPNAIARVATQPASESRPLPAINMTMPSPEDGLDRMLSANELSLEKLFELEAPAQHSVARASETAEDVTVDDLFKGILPETKEEQVTRVINERKLTLEDLLDPNFCGYTQ